MVGNRQTLRTFAAPVLVSVWSHTCSTTLRVSTVQHKGGARPCFCWRQALLHRRQVGCNAFHRKLCACSPLKRN